MQRGDAVRRESGARQTAVFGRPVANRETTRARDGIVADRAIRPSIHFDTQPDLDALADEHPITVEINARPVASLLCTGNDLQELGAGWVFCQGYVQTADEIRSVTPRANRVSVMIDAPGPGGTAWQSLFSSGFDARQFIPGGLGKSSLPPVPGPDSAGPWPIPAGVFTSIVNRVFDSFRGAPGLDGIHHAACTDGRETLVTMRDISRHCAVDKVIGRVLMRRILPERQVLCLSGRVSTDIVFKAWRIGFPVIATRSAPTRDAVRLADHAGITVIGDVLDVRRSVYSHQWRIASEA